MNFDHWKDVEKTGTEPPGAPKPVSGRLAEGSARRGSEDGNPKPARSIPINRAYTRMPSGSRKVPGRAEIIPPSAAAKPVNREAPGGTSSGGVQHHFVAGEPATDMDIAFLDTGH